MENYLQLNLLERPSSSGLTDLAITDHDSLEGLDGLDIPDSLNIIPGVEISTTWEGKTIHVVGLNIDKQDQALRVALEQIRIKRKERAKAIAVLLEKYLKLENCYEGFS